MSITPISMLLWQHTPYWRVGCSLLVYAAVTATSVPGALLLTITGGLLFGTALGTALAVLGATTGATIIFILARSAFGDVLKGRAGAWVERMAEGFRENAFSYLLVLRLVPLVPFFVVNLVPAFLGVSLRTYVLATLLGIIPGAFVYASVGVGLRDILRVGELVLAIGRTHTERDNGSGRLRHSLASARSVQKAQERTR